MKVLIFGGAGFIGQNIIKELLAGGYEIYVMTRNRQKAATRLESEVNIIEWDNGCPLDFTGDLKDIDIVINLAGESIANHRWFSPVKERIISSRLRTTCTIVAAINNHTMEPRLLINASAVGYYGACEDEEILETREPGADFLANVCRVWEREAYKVESDLTRVVTTRFGMVLGNGGGALNRMLLPYKFNVGGPLGSGKQWISWIHIKDLTRMIRFIIDHEEVKGPINVTSPTPVRMKDFSKVLGSVLKKPSWMPVPEFLLKIALGEMSGIVVKGQRVIPQKVMKEGFEFKFPDVRLALKDILETQKN